MEEVGKPRVDRCSVTPERSSATSRNTSLRLALVSVRQQPSTGGETLLSGVRQTLDLMHIQAWPLPITFCGKLLNSSMPPFPSKTKMIPFSTCKWWEVKHGKGFPGGSDGKDSACTWVWSLGWEDPLEEGMATHSSILAWRITWAEKPGRLQAMRS